MGQNLYGWEPHQQIKIALMNELKAIKSCGIPLFSVKNLFVLRI